MLAELDGSINVVPYIHVSENVVVDRLLKRAELEGRSDDNADTIRTRMEVYYDKTQPLLDYYQEKGLLVEVNGEQTIAQVFTDLLAVIQSAS